MPGLTREAIECIFKDGPKRGDQVFDGLVKIVRKSGETQDVLTPLATVRYFPLESLTDASIATMRGGVRARLPRSFPKAVSAEKDGEVQLYFDTITLRQYVALVGQDGLYNLARK